MQTVSLPELAAAHLQTARSASSGRSAQTIHGGHDHPLRQTLIALADGRSLDDHESPAEASLQIVHGRVRLITATEHWDGAPGDYLVIPSDRHRVTALEDAAVLLTVAMDLGRSTRRPGGAGSGGAESGGAVSGGTGSGGAVSGGAVSGGAGSGGAE